MGVRAPVGTPCVGGDAAGSPRDRPQAQHGEQLTKVLLGRRALIETMFDHFDHQVHIDYTWHWSLTNFIVNLVAKLSGYCHHPNKPFIIVVHDHNAHRVSRNDVIRSYGLTVAIMVRLWVIHADPVHAHG